MQNTLQEQLVQEKPWYRQFWPWFVIALPASAVIAGLSTLAIAVKYQDSVVKDDWYQAGKSINLNLERNQRAAALGLSATIAIDALTGDVLVSLTPAPRSIGPLQLAFTHPTHADADQTLNLLPRPDGRYHGLLQSGLNGRFDIELGNPEWRLLGTGNFPASQVALTHD